MNHLDVLELAWKGGAVTVVTLLALSVMWSASAAEKSLVADLGLLAVLALPLLILCLPQISVEMPRSLLAIQTHLPFDIPAPGAEAGEPGGGRERGVAHDEPSIPIGQIILTLYAAGAGLFLARLLFAVNALRRIESAAKPIGREWQAAAETVRSQLNVRRRVDVVVAAELEYPIGWGIWRPVVILDANTALMTKDAVTVMRHELAHISRWDWPRLILARLAVAIHWFNPLIWLLARKANLAAEQAADDIALAGAATGPCYAETLVRIARAAHVRSKLLANDVVASQSALMRRVNALLEPRRRNNVASKALFAATMAAVAVTLPLATLRPVGAANAATLASRGLAPFEIVFRVIYVQGTIDGSRPLWFLISSGSGGSAIDLGTAKELGIAAASGTAKSGPVTASIGGASFPIQAMSVMDLAAAENQVGHEIDAVIGYELFKRYVVEIDYYGNILRLHEPANYRPDPHAAAIPIRVTNNHAYLQADVKLAGRDSVLREYKLDTGLGGALIDDDVTLATSPKLEIVGGFQGEAFTITLTRVETVSLGPFTFRGANGISGGKAIGGELLRRFKTVFDYGRERLFLLPNRHYDDRFCFEMLGVELSTARSEGGLRLDAIYKNSVAEKAGFKVGDILTAIDGKPALGIPLGQVSMMFGQQSFYVLTLRRGETTRVVPVDLQPTL